MPAFCIFIGANYIIKSGNISFTKRFYGIVLFIINSLLFIQMAVLSNYYLKDNIMLGAGKVYNSSSIVHGGIIGYFLSVPLYTLFGKLGSYIIFIAII